MEDDPSGPSILQDPSDDVAEKADIVQHSTQHAPFTTTTDPSDSGIESIANGESTNEIAEMRTRTRIVDLML